MTSTRPSRASRPSKPVPQQGGAARPRGGFGDLPGLAGWPFFPVAFLARLPLAMLTVGVTILVVETRGSIAAAGLTAGAVGVGTMIGGPIIGALVDKLGQRRVLRIVGPLNTAAIVSLLVLAHLPIHLALLLATGVVLGGSAPNVGVYARSRWIELVDDLDSAGRRRRTLDAALGYESTADELTFVLGPVAVGVLALGFGTTTPLIVAAAFTLVFVTWFSIYRTGDEYRTERPAPPPPSPLRSILRPDVLAPVIGMLGIGSFFGVTLTSVIAYADERGSTDYSGLIYGAMSICSAACALLVTKLSRRITMSTRWVIGASIMSVGALVLPRVSDLAPVMTGLAVMGIGLGPAMVSMFGVASQTSPTGRNNIVMTLMTSGIVAGTAITSPITGFVAEAQGSARAMQLIIVCTAWIGLAGILSLWAARRAAQRRRESTDSR